jgi:hypothetical protein
MRSGEVGFGRLQTYETLPSRSTEARTEWLSHARSAEVGSESGEVTLAFPFEIKYARLPPNTEFRQDGFGMRAAYLRRTEEDSTEVEVVRATEGEGAQPSEEP